MNKKYIFHSLLCSLLTLLITTSIYASQYGPNMLFQKPYEPDDNIGNFAGTFCVGKTDQCYNNAGQVVPFLQGYGKEDILLNFIDSTIHHTNTTKIGTIDFTGTLQFQCTNLSYYKNIMHHLFIGLGTVIQNLDINKIQPHIDITTELTLEQEKQLEIFISKIPTNLNTSGILSTYLEAGYNRKFTKFHAIEFLQPYLKLSILTPQWAQGGNLNLLQYPFTGNLTFGYQVIGIITMGLLPHMNIGIFGTVNSFQATTMEVAYNDHIPNNQLLINKTTPAHYTPGSVYNGAIYWEITNFKSPITLTTGLSFMYGTPRKIKPINTHTFHVKPESDINLKVNTTLDSWNISTLFFEFDYNFLSEENTEGPCLTLYFNTPISGYNYPKTNAIGGEFGLTFNYHF